MSFKHKLMRARQARSALLITPEPPRQSATIPPWSELVSMNAEQVAALAAALGIQTTGNLMADKSAIHKARP